MHDRSDVIARAIDAYQALAELAENIEDEWQYVTALVDAYLPVIETLGASDTADTLTAPQIEAVDELITEIGLITDPHKAIDWLSTFPNVLALILDADSGARGGSDR